MAFTGTATVKQISDSKVRITGLSLGIGASGTIGLFGDATAGVNLPDAFNPKVYDFNGSDVALADSLQCYVVADGAVTVAPAVHIAKAGTPFQITLTNGGAAASGSIEIWVIYH